MKFVLAKCTQCGDTLEVDNSKEAAICPSCGSAFIVEKAIHSYNVTNNISASVVDVYGNQTGDFIIRGGVLEKYIGQSVNPVIPDTVVEIGKESFMNTRIVSVAIPDSVDGIQDSAFKNCFSLETIKMSDNITYIGSHAFSHCGSLTGISFPKQLKKIGGGAFSHCGSLTSIPLPKQLKKINDGAFSHCGNLKSISFPEQLKEIGIGAFSGCNSLVEVQFPPNLTEIHKEAFLGCNSLESINIPSVIRIGEGSFSDCSSMKNARLSPNLKIIETKAFHNCSSLSEITIPSVHVIERWAFQGCTVLNKLVLPANLEEIGLWAYHEGIGYGYPIFPLSDNITDVVILGDVDKIEGLNGMYKDRHNSYTNCFRNENVNLKVSFPNSTRKPVFPNRPQKGCYIATAVYGTYDCPQLWTLRRFRDKWLLKTIPGRFFIGVYYATSPILVKVFGKHRWFTGFCKKLLDSFVKYLNQKGITDDRYND